MPTQPKPPRNRQSRIERQRQKMPIVHSLFRRKLLDAEKQKEEVSAEKQEVKAAELAEKTKQDIARETELLKKGGVADVPNGDMNAMKARLPPFNNFEEFLQNDAARAY
mmetsp:Transcript_35419/g.111452  ORF Transcript_35419/g.111452 Transcript_35419/m.111452 type:complete len:109 (-) Transcript_35419:316-642(-)